MRWTYIRQIEALSCRKIKVTGLITGNQRAYDLEFSISGQFFRIIWPGWL